MGATREEALTAVRHLLASAVRILDEALGPVAPATPTPPNAHKRPRAHHEDDQVRGWICDVLADADGPLQGFALHRALKDLGYQNSYASLRKVLANFDEVVNDPKTGYSLRQ
jgi:hypothetical protein